MYLKNGECVPLGGASAPVNNEDGTWSFYITGTFDRLIFLDEMDKVTLGHYEYKVNEAIKKGSHRGIMISVLVIMLGSLLFYSH